jgi:hypothetical protein
MRTRGLYGESPKFPTLATLVEDDFATTFHGLREDASGLSNENALDVDADARPAVITNERLPRSP